MYYVSQCLSRDQESRKGLSGHLGLSLLRSFSGVLWDWSHKKPQLGLTVTHSQDCQVDGSWRQEALVSPHMPLSINLLFMTWWLTSSGVHDQRDKSKSSNILWLIFKELLPIPSVNSIGLIDQSDIKKEGPWIPGGKYLWGCLWGWLLQPQLMTVN